MVAVVVVEKLQNHGTYGNNSSNFIKGKPQSTTKSGIMSKVKKDFHFEYDYLS